MRVAVYVSSLCVYYKKLVGSYVCVLYFFFFQAEDGIRDLVRSRGLGDVYKRQVVYGLKNKIQSSIANVTPASVLAAQHRKQAEPGSCLLYTSDAADDLLCVDLGGRRIIKKKKQVKSSNHHRLTYDV